MEKVNHKLINQGLLAYIAKMRGCDRLSPSKLCVEEILVSAIGSFLGIGLVGLLSELYAMPLLLPSFGASAVLLYAACHVPMAQPRNVVGGHLLSALVGVSVYQALGVAGGP